MCAQTYNNYCHPSVKYLLIRPLISIIKMSIIIQSISFLCFFGKTVIGKMTGKESEYLVGYQLTAEYSRPIISYGKAELI